MKPLISAETIELNTLTIPVVRHVRRKRLTIEVSHNGVVIRAPKRMLTGTIKRFAKQKEDWINKHLKNIPEQKPDIKLDNYARLPFLGKEIHLSIKEGVRGPAQLSADLLVLPVVRSSIALEKTILNKLVGWYKQQALDHFERRVAFYSQQMKLFPSHIKVRDYKRRWGSCSHQGQLSFNWRLIMAPENTINYVIVHELAHLKEFNHSKHFWIIVEKQMPQWRDQKKWLNQFGADLYPF